MDDADEDLIGRSGSLPEEADPSDETQDFRFLAAISRENAKIPKRGEKDFEPHATALQADTLEASRLAMHSALAFQRVHQPKGYTKAIYHAQSNMAYAINPKGPLFVRMGHVRSAGTDPLGDDELRGSRLWLLPEEVLYLIERGTVDVRWPVSEGNEDGEGLPMSLQAAYAMFLGDEASHDGALTMERYTVYTALKRVGYTVQRAPSWDGPGSSLVPDCFPSSSGNSWIPGLFGFQSLWTRVLTALSPKRTGMKGDGPLVERHLYRSYIDVYRRLALVGSYDAVSSNGSTASPNPNTDPQFRITFHVWKPGSATFKKSDPGIPDFRIAVFSARETRVPTLQQLSALMETLPYDLPKESAQLYQKLKHGSKNLVLAVVDQGVISYIRVADSVFGGEKLYERTNKGPGAKRGGRRGGRGRGR